MRSLIGLLTLGLVFSLVVSSHADDAVPKPRKDRLEKSDKELIQGRWRYISVNENDTDFQNREGQPDLLFEGDVCVWW